MNFGSGNVSVFVKDFERATLRLESVIRAIGSPVTSRSATTICTS